jgi:Regulator of chromosome condensation (RCC1) repeat
MRLQISAFLVFWSLVLGCSEPQDIRFLNQLVDAGGTPCVDASALGETCAVGTGECERTGTLECNEGMVTCSATAGAASDELCGTERDEDCDGTVDEAPASGCCSDADCEQLEVCERPESDDLAAGTCKPAGDEHADCKLDDGEIACVCQEGYEGDGKTCVRNACIAIGDDPPPCGENQSCEPAAPGKKECACIDGFGDCNADAADGCETDLATNAAHCGACGIACAGGISCVEGACEPRLTTMSLGFWGTLGLTADSKLMGWGGQAILYDKTEHSPTPVFVNVGTAVQIAQGESYACLVRPSKDLLVCWGDNAQYQLGVADTMAEYKETPIADIIALGLGQWTTCVAAGPTGKVYCWGYGAAGITNSPDKNVYDSSSSVIAGVTNAVELGVGLEFACALTGTGRVYCWGKNGGTKYPPELVRGLGAGEPVLEDAVSLRASNGHACALRKDSTLVCWGANDSGQLGVGSTTPVARNRYVTVDLPAVAEFSAGGAHTCAVTTKGALWCWGANNNAALGVETPSFQKSAWPIENTVLTNVVDVHGGVGSAHTCATVHDGRIYCWGYNYYCQLGSGNCPSGGPQVTPTEVTEWP